MNKELLHKYLNNNCTDAEFDVLVSWIIKEAASKEGKSWGFDDWNSFDPDMKNKDNQKYQSLLNKIHSEIKRKEQRKSKTINMDKAASLFSRAAAILFIPLLGLVIYLLANNNTQFNQYTDLAVDSLEIIAPIGSRTVVQLSDGTEVNLNYGSKIKYPRHFKGDTREISLEGEGYFDVAHNPDKPFIVKTGQLNVKALGTEFNVHAYPEDNIISTTLVEGKVIIEKLLADEKTESVGTMVPGQHIDYNLNSGKTTSIIGSVEKYVAWKEGKLIFDDAPITSVAEKLSRMFNVDIEVADNIKNYSYTVTLIDDPLLLILDLMAEVTDITYKVYPRKKLANGTFSKQKIRIEKRTLKLNE
uniref:FecR family protein n=1 Tax=uncultured Draconibacterium sp. TaxID=1573823 RepID=UPI003217B037